MMPTARARYRLTRDFEAANLACAKLILCRVQFYGGDGSLMVRWAHAIVESREATDRTWGLVA